MPLGISADCDMHWQTAQSLPHCGGVPAAEWLAHTCLSVVIVLVCELKGKAIFRLNISHRLWIVCKDDQPGWFFGFAHPSVPPWLGVYGKSRKVSLGNTM